MGPAPVVIYAGCSAGGRGVSVMHNLNYVQDQVCGEEGGGRESG